VRLRRQTLMRRNAKGEVTGALKYKSYIVAQYVIALLKWKGANAVITGRLSFAIYALALKKLQ
jgi:hypothetical protein